MIFQPVLHPVLLLLLLGPVVAIGVIGIVRSRSGGSRTVWAARIGLVLVCFTLLLRPGIPGGTAQTLSTDTDIVLVVDSTASMVAEDWDGDKPRLDGVRADVQQIVEHYPGARFALITFDAKPQLRLPLTTDSSALVSSLEVLRPETTKNSQGSSVGNAHAMLADTLKRAAEANDGGARARMVFYLGDGEQTAASEPESFADAAKYVDGGQVFGYGTAEGGPMRETTGRGDAADAPYIEYQGQDALSKIDEGNLEAIGEQLGVPYQHRTADAAPSLPDAPTTSTDFADGGEKGSVIELYPYLALVALLLLAFEIGRAAMQVARLRGLRAQTERVPSRFRPNRGGER